MDFRRLITARFRRRYAINWETGPRTFRIVLGPVFVENRCPWHPGPALV